MNTCTPKEYRKAFRDQIYEIYSPRCCSVCGNIVRFRSGERKKDHLGCYRIGNRQNLQKHTVKSLTINWFETTFRDMGRTYKLSFVDYDFHFMAFAYKNLHVSKIKDFLETSYYFVYLIHKPRSQSEKDENVQWIRQILRVYSCNPNITSKDVVNELEYLLNYDGVIYLHLFMRAMRKLNDSKVSRLWPEWEMKSNEYTNMCQWFPEEMVVSIGELEGKLGDRFSISTY